MNEIRTCSAEGCDRKAVAKGLCDKHYQRVRFNTKGPERRKKLGPFSVTSLTPINGMCGVEGCGRVLKQRGMCALHYGRAYHYGDVGDAKPMTRSATRVPCSVEGCGKEARAQGYCQTHYARLRATGEVGEADLLRAAAGEGYINEAGYRLVGGEFEHRTVMEKKLGRALAAGENVHHIDGDRVNNDPDNLELWVTQQPAGQRIEDKMAAAIKLFREYSEIASQQGVRLINLESQEATDLLVNEMVHDGVYPEFIGFWS